MTHTRRSKPIASQPHLSTEAQEEPLRVLFVCSRNQWRSPTAEEVWRKHPALQVRSGGTSPRAKHRVNTADLQWAQVIFVMEEKHQALLLANFGDLVSPIPIHVLDIPDVYRFMDPELIEEVRHSVAAILKLGDLTRVGATEK